MRQGTIKPEVRVLAVTVLPIGKSPLRALLLFVVLRGRLWLEGVFTANVERVLTSALAKAIVKSRYYKELRFLILDSAVLKPPFSVNPVKVAMDTGLPVLTLVSGKAIEAVTSVGMQTLKLTVKSGKPVYVAYWGVDEGRVNALVKLMRVGKTLEPLRVLQLLRKHLSPLLTPPQ